MKGTRINRAMGRYVHLRTEIAVSFVAVPGLVFQRICGRRAVSMCLNRSE